MKLVMVHGRAQGGRDAAEIEKEWRDALIYGAVRANVQIPPETEFVFPYYGDEIDRLVAEVDAPLTASVSARGDIGEDDLTVRGEVLEEIAAGLGLSERDVDREFGGDARERGIKNWEWVHSILKALDRFPGISAKAIDLFTRDVNVYLGYPVARNRIDRIVEDALPREPYVVLAHSLGTVVAYNVLRGRARDPRCLRLVTVGSPLGLRAIQRHLETPHESPRCVEHWFNAYDERDIVALNPLDGHHFNVSPAVKNKSDVQNFTENRHGIAGYLADPDVARAVCGAQAEPGQATLR